MGISGDRQYDAAVDVTREELRKHLEFRMPYDDLDDVLAASAEIMEVIRFKLCDYTATQVADAISESTAGVTWTPDIELVLQRIAGYFGVADEDLECAYKEHGQFDTTREMGYFEADTSMLTLHLPQDGSDHDAK